MLRCFGVVLAFLVLPLPACGRSAPGTAEVVVTATYEGQPAEVVEQEVTVPLEQALAGAPWARRLRSVSARGSATVRLRLDRRADVFAARQDARERLERVLRQLPDGVMPAVSGAREPEVDAGRYVLSAPALD
ncbi:MAG TPA: efflux RND transporter permease subunit, partial [Polyangia bacterium]